jgi:hypothetical protein
LPDNGDDGALAVRLLWIDLDETPIYSSDQAIAQIDRDRIVLTFGSASPPIIIGDTVEERRQSAENIGYVPVRVIAKVAMTRDRLADSVRVLTEILNTFDKMQGGKL